MPFDALVFTVIKDIFLTGSSVYMIASTVSTKMLQSMAREEGFVFKVRKLLKENLLCEQWST